MHPRLLAVALAVPLGLALPAAAQAAQPVLPPSIVVSAHRGGSAYAPENTLTAFRNAVRLGVDQLETDTQLTSDGKLVLIHDSTLDRTTSCTGNVQDKTLAQVRGCDAGFWWTPGQGVTVDDPALPHPLRGRGIQVPEAHEIFGLVTSLGPADRTTISIEIKDIPGEANFDATGTRTAAQLVPLIQGSGLKARTIVQSFYPPALTVVKRMDPTLRTQLLTVGAATPYLAQAVADGDDIVAPDSTQPDVTTTFVTAAHTAGRQVIPYTPDTAAELTRVGRLGVDGEITNFPACLLDLEGRPHPAQLLPADSVAAGSGPVPTCAAGSAAGPAPVVPAPVVPEVPWAALPAAAAAAVLAGAAVRRHRPSHADAAG